MFAKRLAISTYQLIANKQWQMQSQPLSGYINMMINKPDCERINSLGPDRSCAEWVLRNGGEIVLKNGKTLAGYNSLPPEGDCVPEIVAIDGTDSSISHYGFSHISGCTNLKKIILHDNIYIDNKAMEGLAYAKDTLSHVQVSKCANVTDAGVKELKHLSKLNTLILFDLGGVKNIEECKQYLKSQLPNCKIEGTPKKTKAPKTMPCG